MRRKEGEIMKYRDQFERIKRMEPGWERDRKLADLMTELERLGIPMLKNHRWEEWKRRNPELWKLYREISDARGK